MRHDAHKGSQADADDHAHWDAVENATELLREGDVDGAMRELRAVIDGDPRNPYAHCFLADAQFERGEHEAARAGYERALEHAPQYLGALVGLGHALRLLGRTAEAVRAGERALAMRAARDASSHEIAAVPSAPLDLARDSADVAADQDAHFLLGLAHMQAGDKLRARRHLEAVLAGRPEVELQHEVRGLLDTLSQ